MICRGRLFMLFSCSPSSNVKQNIGIEMCAYVSLKRKETINLSENECHYYCHIFADEKRKHFLHRKSTSVHVKVSEMSWKLGGKSRNRKWETGYAHSFADHHYLIESFFPLPAANETSLKSLMPSSDDSSLRKSDARASSKMISFPFGRRRRNIVKLCSSRPMSPTPPTRANLSANATKSWGTLWVRVGSPARWKDKRVKHIEICSL